MSAEMMAALSARANVAGKADLMTQLRADFKTVFDAYRAHGSISDAEMKQQIADAGAAIRERSGDKEWMDCATNHFRQMASQIETDKAFAGRISDEVRAERKAA